MSKYVCNEVLVRGLSPDSITGSYLTHIKNSFDITGIENHFAAVLISPIFKLSIRGVKRIHSEKNPEGGVKKIAFTLELVKYMDAALPPVPHSIDSWKESLRRRALVVGLELGIYYLLRRSEFLPCRTSSHEVSRGIRWRDIKFLDIEGRSIEFNCVSLANAVSASVTVVKSKMDQFGKGRTRTHKKQIPGHCIVAVLVSWLLVSKSHGTGPEGYVFERAGIPIISDDDINAVMKGIAKFAGLTSNKTSTHSLRYGGATLLAAAGIPAYAITHFGGWAEGSKMINQYIQLGGQMTDDVSRAMSEAHGKSLVEARVRDNTLGRI
jgi:hypothetical protein